MIQRFKSLSGIQYLACVCFLNFFGSFSAGFGRVLVDFCGDICMCACCFLS